MSNQPLLNRIANDWAPPKLVSAVRRRRAAAAPQSEPKAADQSAASPQAAAAAGAAAAASVEEPAPPADDPRWAKLTDRTLTELRECDSIFRPTSFWGPALDQLLGDMTALGLSQFKRWPSAGFWFLPTYGQGFINATIRQLFRRASNLNPSATRDYVSSALNGMFLGFRDYDALRLAWDQSRWPADLEGVGESTLGDPWQLFPLSPVKGVRFGRAYVNYLLMMAALSRHIDAAPKRVLEIGGGFGVLGEILLARDPEATYVNLDIPPLVTVSSYYLTELFGDDRVQTYDDSIAATGPIEVTGSAVLPNYRLPDITGPFDVFVNSFSFQEMEPDVVEHYAAEVSRLDAEWIVSLNSRHGKPTVADGNAIGVVDPVTSARIIDIFGRHGYELQETFNRPLVNSFGEVAVLRRRRS